jgi:hypothetical protein
MVSVKMIEPTIYLDEFKFLVLKTNYTSRLTYLDKYFMMNHDWAYECFDEDDPESESIPMIVAIRDKLWGSDDEGTSVKVYDKERLNQFENIVGIPNNSFENCKELDGTIVFTSTNKDENLSFSDLGHILEMIGTSGEHSYCAHLSSASLLGMKIYGETNDVLIAEFDTSSG